MIPRFYFSRLLKVFRKIGVFFNYLVVKVVLISLVTVLVVLGSIVALVWHYKDDAVRFLTKVSVDQYRTLYISDTASRVSTAVDAPLPIVSNEEEYTVVNAVKKSKPAVVSIVITRDVPKYEIVYEERTIVPGIIIQTPVSKQIGVEKKEIGEGSGFLISSDGLIVTNRHVVAQTGAEYTVILNNGKKYTARVLDRDPVRDVAVMKITASNLPYLEFGNSDTIEVGETVIAIGNALAEFKNSVSVGVVSGLARSVIAGDKSGYTEKLDKVIQTDAAINPGNSGGPLLDMKGSVIGINVAVVKESSSIGFALPINSVKSVIDQVRKNGKIIRPYLGIRYVQITEEVKKKNNLSVSYGVLVEKDPNGNGPAVVIGSPAEKVGIIEGDVILQIDETVLTSDTSFTSVINTKKVGQTVSLRIISKGLEKTIRVKLEQSPGNI